MNKLTSIEVAIVITLHKTTCDMEIKKACSIISECLAEYRQAIKDLDTYGVIESLCNLNIRYKLHKDLLV